MFFFFTLSAARPSWVSQRWLYVDSSDTPHSVKRMTSPRGRHRQFGSQNTLNKRKFSLNQMEPNRTPETVYPMTTGSNSGTTELNTRISQILLQHQTKVLDPETEPCMVRQRGKLAGFSMPFAINLRDEPWPLSTLETYVQLEVRNPTKRLSSVTDAGKPSLYIGC